MTERHRIDTFETPVFELSPLPYGIDSLAPVLSREALEIHYGKHHARYVETVNQLLQEQNFSAPTLKNIIRIAHASGARALLNNAAQAWNHSFFWESMSPRPSQPNGALADSINSTFGSLAELGKRFSAEGTGHFGSGWIWLIAKRDRLEVVSTHDAGSPILEDGATPLLACDVWEHAYYIDYRQNRANWLASWWDQLANWSFAERQYAAALGQADAWQYPATTPVAE